MRGGPCFRCTMGKYAAMRGKMKAIERVRQESDILESILKPHERSERCRFEAYRHECLLFSMPVTACCCETYVGDKKEGLMKDTDVVDAAVSYYGLYLMGVSVSSDNLVKMFTGMRRCLWLT
jgi:hypothetical protein